VAESIDQKLGRCVVWSHHFWSIWDLVASGSGTQSHQVLVFAETPVAFTSGISQPRANTLSLTANGPAPGLPMCPVASVMCRFSIFRYIDSLHERGWQSPESGLAQVG
jgi:hypothetical protein